MSRSAPQSNSSSSSSSSSPSSSSAATAPRAGDLDCVTLSTIHSAKGLEWRVVFGLHMIEGIFPRGNGAGAMLDDDDEEQDQVAQQQAHREFARQLAEERRVCFVLASRVKGLLLVRERAGAALVV